MDRPGVGASPRRRRFTTRRLMLMAMAVACVPGWGLSMERSRRRVRWAGIRFFVLMITQHQREAPLKIDDCHLSLGWTCDGYFWTHRELLKPPTGRRIEVAMEARSSFFGSTAGATFSSAGRSVAWTTEDLEKRRPIDLQAEFLEALR